MEKEEPFFVNAWLSVSFKINWSDEAEPGWHIDLLLAHKVISPILDEFKDNILLWRFHRRAARDKAGHQFTFYFYSSTETANQIYESIKSNRILQKIKDAGIVVSDSYYDKINRPNIEDTSDPKWSPLISKSWPYFINGVCRMWLNLVASIAEQTSIECY